jgi:DnaK suppressor protein
MRRALLAEQADLRCLLSGLDYDPAGNGKDEGDVAVASERREATARDIDRALTRLGEIDIALERLDGGVYGLCTACGRPIPMARLKALPSATTCVECQARAERQADDARHRPMLRRPMAIDEDGC